ncbi:hypothetical protein NFI96_000075, partial [Prochilodus magdalenae]
MYTDMNLLIGIVALGLCHIFNNPTDSASAQESLGRPFILESIEEAKRLVDDAYLYSRQESLARVRKNTFIKPSDKLRLMKQPARKTRDAVRAADYLQQTLRIIAEKTHHAHKRSINATALITPEELRTIERLTGCAAQVQPPSCRTTPLINKYRTANSVCNNRKNSLLGAANTPLARWLPAIYEDGISQPVGWDPSRLYNGVLLPLVRLVSNRILSTADADVQGDSELTHMITFFGQWIDHDLTLTPQSPSIRSFSNGINCDESCERTEPCFPIQFPSGDTRQPTPAPNSCLPVFRSAPACGSGNNAFIFGGMPKVRQQINSLTAFLDVGQVYGSDAGLARELRDLSNDFGLLLVNDRFQDNGRELLPFTKMNSNICRTRNNILNTTGLEEVPCFIAGDSRVDENIALTSLHTLFLREHNRLARALRLLNPQWSSETLYQEARKIMGAYHQILVFRNYLGPIVGPDALQNQLGPYPGYDPNTDPSIANVFATAAYRFAHATIQPLVFRLDENFENHPQFPSVPLFEAFITPWRVVFEGGIDPLIRGLIGKPAKLNQQDHLLVNALREKLFAFTSRIAMDLASLNMQRSRDHALPGYNMWRKFCNLSTPQNEAELATVLNNTDLAHRLIELYGHPDNIDIWLAGIAEPFVPRGRVGPLFSCLIATQFQKIRQGDRLWWENPGTFTQSQRRSLASVSLARIICDNTNIRRVPADPFLFRNPRTEFVDCNEIPDIDLTPWIEAGPPGPVAITEPKQSAFSMNLGSVSDSSALNRVIIFRETIFNNLNEYSTQTGEFTCRVPAVFVWWCVYGNPSVAYGVGVYSVCVESVCVCVCALWVWCAVCVCGVFVCGWVCECMSCVVVGSLVSLQVATLGCMHVWLAGVELDLARNGDSERPGVRLGLVTTAKSSGEASAKVCCGPLVTECRGWWAVDGGSGRAGVYWGGSWNGVPLPYSEAGLEGYGCGVYATGGTSAGCTAEARNGASFSVKNQSVEDAGLYHSVWPVVWPVRTAEATGWRMARSFRRCHRHFLARVTPGRSLRQLEVSDLSYFSSTLLVWKSVALQSIAGGQYLEIGDVGSIGGRGYSGQYSCVVSNIAGSSQSPVCGGDSLIAPRLNPRGQLISHGASICQSRNVVLLSCVRWKDRPPPAVLWRKDGVPGSSRAVARSVLEILSTSLRMDSHAGRYTCTALATWWSGPINTITGLSVHGARQSDGDGCRRDSRALLPCAAQGLAGSQRVTVGEEWETAVSQPSQGNSLCSRSGESRFIEEGARHQRVQVSAHVHKRLRSWACQRFLDQPSREFTSGAHDPEVVGQSTSCTLVPAMLSGTPFFPAVTWNSQQSHPLH